MTEFEDNLFTDWASSVPQQCEQNLHLNIITRRNDGRDLILNFHPQVNCTDYNLTAQNNFLYNFKLLFQIYQAIFYISYQI